MGMEGIRGSSPDYQIPKNLPNKGPEESMGPRSATEQRFISGKRDSKGIVKTAAKVTVGAGAAVGLGFGLVKIGVWAKVAAFAIKAFKVIGLLIAANIWPIAVALCAAVLIGLLAMHLRNSYLKRKAAKEAGIPDSGKIQNLDYPNPLLIEHMQYSSYNRNNPQTKFF